MSGCDCFSTTLATMKERLESGDYSRVPVEKTDLNVEWQNQIFVFSGDYVPVNPKILFSFRAKKKDGSPAAKLSRGEVSVMCNFCPFCGRELNKEKESNHAAFSKN